MLKIGPSNSFIYCLNDPSTPSLSIKVPLLKVSDIHPKIEVIGYREGPLVQQDAIRVQAANVLYSIWFTLAWINKIRRVEKWAATDVLTISPRAGKQFNAYYDRYGLRFFYEVHPVTKKVVFSADSTEAVNHEFGHAILDSFRPDFWELDSFEIFCFHEAFGDIISMLSSLHHQPVIDYVLLETGGDLSVSNIVSRITEELGNAIFCKEPTAGRPKNCLRDASEAFQYVVPDSLPSKGLFNVLCREAHNFSRVFSSAWYKIFVELYEKYNSITDARNIIAKLSILCLEKIEKRKDIYCSVAQAMITTDKQHFNGKHVSLLRKVFMYRNILPQVILLN